MQKSPERQVADRARAARAASIELDGLLATSDVDEDLKVAVSTSAGDRLVPLPRKAVELLVEVLEALGDGRDPSVVPMNKELTTGDVARLLGVSRQYAVRLLDDGRLPFRRVGNRRRVPLTAVMRYLREDNRRLDGLRELADATVS
jgi:excisionase family DNA binding protein